MSEARRASSPSLITIGEGGGVFRANHPAFMNDYSGSDSKSHTPKKVASKLIVSPVVSKNNEVVAKPLVKSRTDENMAELFARQVQPLLVPITKQSEIFDSLVGKFRDQEEREFEPVSEPEGQIMFPESVGVGTFPDRLTSVASEGGESDDECAVVITKAIVKKVDASVAVVPIIKRVELENDVVAGILQSRSVRVAARKREFQGADKGDKEALESFLGGMFWRYAFANWLYVGFWMMLRGER